MRIPIALVPAVFHMSAQPSLFQKALLHFANLLRRLSHPNVMVLHGARFTSVHTYICTDVAKMSLYKYLRQERPIFNNGKSPALGVCELLEVCAQVAAGLEHLHEKLIAHSALRCEHVYVASNGQLKLYVVKESAQLKTMNGKIGMRG